MLMFGPYVNAVLCHFLACNFNALCWYCFRFVEFNYFGFQNIFMWVCGWIKTDNMYKVWLVDRR